MEATTESVDILQKADERTKYPRNF
jgi:hypothetical protein